MVSTGINWDQLVPVAGQLVSAGNELGAVGPSNKWFQLVTGSSYCSTGFSWESIGIIGPSCKCSQLVAVPSYRSTDRQRGP